MCYLKVKNETKQNQTKNQRTPHTATLRRLFEGALFVNTWWGTEHSAGEAGAPRSGPSWSSSVVGARSLS